MKTAVKTVTSPFVYLAKPDVSNVEEKLVLDVLRSGWLGNGAVSKQLEHEFAEYFHPTNPKLLGLATNACTSGLILALKSAGVGPGDEVITSPLTFAATVNAIIQVGAIPVFVDVDQNGCLNPEDIDESATDKTKAIIPVHLAGHPCEMDGILEKAKFHGMIVIEDAAHAFGGDYHGRPLGSIGHYGVFSFYPTKNLASGDGGMVLTDRLDKLREMRLCASQGLSASAWMRYGSGPVKTYRVETDGMKALMNDLNAAVALGQLRRWPELKQKRDTIWSVYAAEFGEKGKGHSKHLYTISVDNRNLVQKRLHELGIGTGIHYSPLHLEPAYQYLRYRMGDFPVAESIGLSTLSLPLHTQMTVEDAERVIQSVQMVTE